MSALFFSIVALSLLFPSIAFAQLSKVLDSGPDPVGHHKPDPSVYTFTIHLGVGFDPTQVVKDTMPAEFDMLSVVASCGSVTFGEKRKKNPKAKAKKQPDKLRWDLSECLPDSSQTLTITARTDQNPSGAKKGVVRFEPGDCGPLVINEGAELSVAEGEPFISNSLVVATCPVEGDVGCVDSDDDAFSVACNDCNDADPAVHPAAAEVCGDAIDNNCNGPADEGC